jgi:hypothetical protein
MNLSDEIYKKKYLKYKNKYLELKQKGGFFSEIFNGFTQFLDRLTSEEKKSICTRPDYIFDECDNYLEKFKFPPNMTKEGRVVEIDKIKDIMLNSQKENSPIDKIRKIKYTNGDIYSGLLENGMPNGRGVMKYKNGNIYEGTFIKGIPKGKQAIKSEEGTYFGEVTDNKPDGYGEMTYTNGDKYIGEFKNGYKSGQGIFTYANGDKYTGEFKNNNFDGHGIITYTNGFIFDGKFVNGKKNGYGTTTLSTGRGRGYSESGNWIDDNKHGTFKDYAPDGSYSSFSDKEWVNGVRKISGPPRVANSNEKFVKHRRHR